MKPPGKRLMRPVSCGQGCRERSGENVIGGRGNVTNLVALFFFGRGAREVQDFRLKEAFRLEGLAAQGWMDWVGGRSVRAQRFGGICGWAARME